MHKSDIETLIAYNFWADNEILTACEQISVEDFIRSVTPDPGWHSLRGTLVHLLDTEYGWRVALQNLPDTGVLSEEDFPDVASLRARWQREEAAWLAYIASLDDATLNAVWRTEDNIQRTRWQTILHVINDGTYHRSEAAAMLTGYGRSPGELDFEGYLVWRGM
ncbi:DinB family protein [Candidatus Leptofilum sp.]|uniref:DinB family protein n=1 Tax=Candidatus Leptofilum sp. TaxID=3241576 RepID=UPI003B5CF621